MTRNALLASIVLSTGCSQSAIQINDNGDSSTTANDGPSSLPPDAGVPDDEAPERIGGLFLQEPDGGNYYGRECDTFSQDCPTGEKCTFYSNDGSGYWNSTKCEPIHPDPDRLGESCTVVDNGSSGIDSCELGTMCWDVDPDTNVGVCAEYCNGSEANPTCTDPTHHCMGRDFMLCLPSCCPLEESCNEGQGCYPIVDTFACAPDVSGEDDGAFGDVCEFINVCDAGLFCANPERVPGCEGASCCTPFCEVGSDTCEMLHPDLECIAWYEEGQSPLESHVGGCMLPEEE